VTCTIAIVIFSNINQNNAEVLCAMVNEVVPLSVKSPRNYFFLKVKNFQYYCCTVCQVPVAKKLPGKSK